MHSEDHLSYILLETSAWKPREKDLSSLDSGIPISEDSELI